MTEDIIKKTYKLKKGHIVLLKNLLLKGQLPERLAMQLKDAVKKKVPLKDDGRPPEFTMIDDNWDGSEDKTVTYQFNMDKPEARVISFCHEKFGIPFGAIYSLVLLELGSRGSRRGLRARFYHSQKTIFEDVDFGELTEKTEEK